MRMKLDLVEIFQQYLAAYPEEAERQSRFGRFIRRVKDNWWNRKQMAGHVTASGIVIDRARGRMLVVHHVALDRWLQPGGHVDDADDSLRAAAMREVEEETGISAGSLKLVSRGANIDVPLDIDSHDIGPRPEKGEGAHVHHDFRYQFDYVGDGAVKLKNDEVHAFDWWDLAKVQEAQSFRLPQNKIRRP
jgi:8-oxo-dGTP pyrophosphatase MutT (NUDIX family)